MRKRERRLHKLILNCIDQIGLPEGYEVELNNIAAYIKNNKPSLNALRLIEAVLERFQKKIFLTIYRPEFQVVNLRCYLKNIAFELEQRHKGVHLFFGFDAGLVTKMTKVLSYDFRVYDSPCVILFKDVVNVIGSQIELKNGTSLYLKTSKLQWK